MKRIFLKSAVLALLLGAFSAGAAQAEILRIGTEGTYRPWTMAGPSGEVTGFDADIGKAICQKLQAQCVWQVQNLETLIPALAKGRFDMVLSSLSVTPQRAGRIDFSAPYAQSSGRFVVKAGSDLAKISDKKVFYQKLAGKAVGAEAGTIYAQYLQTYLPDSKIQLYGTFDELLTDLNSGRLDAAYEDISVWGAYLGQNKNSGFVYSAVSAAAADENGILSAGIAAGLQKGNDALRARLDKAICALAADGTLKRLSEKWFNGTDISAPCGNGQAH